MYFEGGYGSTLGTRMERQSDVEHPNAPIPVVARGVSYEENT